MTREALRQIIREAEPVPPPSPPVRAYIVAAAAAFRVTADDVLGSSRERSIVDARHVAMALVYAGTTLSLPEVGAEFDRDHTTVLSALRRVQGSPVLASWAAAVRKTIEEGDTDD